MPSQQDGWRFESPKGAKVVRIFKNDYLYASWNAVDGLSEVSLSLPEKVKIALAEGAARFHVNGASGIKDGTVAGVRPAEPELAVQFKVGGHVYHRGSDLFGRIESIDGENAKVKYDWPMSENASPEEVPLSALRHVLGVTR